MDPEQAQQLAPAHAALLRNDQYLKGFIEAFDVCPFARTCRERGQLHRAVLQGQGDVLAAQVVDHVLALHDGDASIEVALLIMPDIGLNAREFEWFVTEVAARVTAARLAQGAQPAFHLVAFHPDLTWRDDDAYRLVGLMRRSPDPTLQLVRISVLAGLRGHAVEEKVYMTREEAEGLDLAARQPQRSLSTRIAEANLRTWQAHADAMAPLLATLPGLFRR